MEGMQAGGGSGNPGRAPHRIRGFELVLVVAAWALLYLPGFGEREFVNEEARRALPARSMLSSGDYLVPRIFERVYLAKPPGMFWLVAGSARLGSPDSTAPGQGIEPAVARIPALLATLGVALLLLLLGRGGPGHLGLLAALLFLFAPLTFEKGALGEIEAPLTLFSFAGSLATYLATKRRGLLLVAGVLVGLAALTKGPPAWIFLGASLLGIGLTRTLGWRVALKSGAVVLSISLVVFGAWLVPLLQEVPWDLARSSWSEELVGSSFSLGSYLGQRRAFVTGALAGFLPGSAFVLAALIRRDTRRELLREELARVALFTLAIGLLFFLLYPRSKPRYVYPLLPWAAWLGARVLSEALRPAPTAWVVSAARVGGYVVGITAVAAAGGLALKLCGVPLLPELQLGDSAPGLLCLTLLTSLVALHCARRRSPVAVLTAAALVLISARLFQAVEITPAYAGRYERASMARLLDEAVPAGEVVTTGHWGEFNLLAHSSRRIRWVPPEELLSSSYEYVLHPCPLEPGTCDWAVCPEGKGRGRFEELQRLRCPKRDFVLSLGRRKDPAPGGR